MSTKPPKAPKMADEDELEDVELAHVKRLYDTPQEQWGVEQWKELALYLHDAHLRAVAVLGRANAAHEQTIALLSDARKDAREFLRLLDQQVRAGFVSIKAPHKKSGRKPRPKIEALNRQEELVELAAKSSPSKVASRLAKEKVEAAGKRIHTYAGDSLFKTFKRSFQTEISEARFQVARRRLIAEHGISLALADELGKIRKPKPRTKVPNNRLDN